MMKKNIFIFFIIIFSTLSAQVKIFRNLTIEDGLAQSYVNAVYQDSKGYMWFGTLHGLTRWDGIYYRNYDLVDGLIGAGINVISEDNAGNVLIGTNLGLSLYKNYKLKNINFPENISSKDIYSFYTDSDNDTYIGLSKGLIKLSGEKIVNPYSDSIVKDKFVYTISGSKDGVIYLGVRGLGLVKLEKNKFEIISESSLFNLSWGNSFFNKKDELIITTRKGFALYKNGKIKFTDLVGNDKNLRIRKLFPGDNDQIFVSTNRGVMIYENGKTDIIDIKNGLKGNSVVTVFRDNSGVYYFGTQAEGVALYDGGRIFSLNKETGFSSNRIYGISEGYDESVYIATYGGGIQKYDGKRVTVISEKKGFPSDNVNDVKKFDDKHIIAATDRGLVIWSKAGVKKIYDKKFGFSSNFFREIFVDSDKTIYAVNHFGLHIIKNNKFTVIDKSKGLPTSNISSVYKLLDGTILLGTENKGLVKVKNSKVSVIDKKDGLADNKVMCVYQSSDGSVLAGTQGGLTIIKEGKIKVYNTLNGLTDNTIYGIGEDDYGNIYLTTNRGVDVISEFSEEINVHNISMKNGLAGNECNARGIYKDVKGRMWIGTLKGTSCYDPSKDNSAKTPPEIKITSVRLYDEIVWEYYDNKNLIFEPDQNYLRFRFLGVNLTAPEQVKYQYRLTNVDPEWVETDVRFARYANLSNGDYTFEVRSKNDGGNWSGVKRVNFTIQAPFYKTWWFIILSVGFIAGTIILIITMRVRQVIEVERLRTKLSADLHDNVGAGLTEISILSEVIAFAKERNSEDVTKNLNLISKTARQLVDSMSDIVWLVNPKRDSLYDLIIRLEENYREILNQKGIAFQSKNLIALESISLPMEYRQHLYLIFKEAINNSLKYSNCNKIFLDANVEGKKLTMHLKDDGKGFDQSRNSNGDGLKNMYERSNLINGKLNIESVEGSGTMIAFEGKITG